MPYCVSAVAQWFETPECALKWQLTTVRTVTYKPAHSHRHVMSGRLRYNMLWNDHGTLSGNILLFMIFQAISVPSLTQSMAVPVARWHVKILSFLYQSCRDLSIIVCFKRTDKSVRRWSQEEQREENKRVAEEIFTDLTDNKHVYQLLKHFVVNIRLHSSVIWEKFMKLDFNMKSYMRSSKTMNETDS